MTDRRRVMGEETHYYLQCHLVNLKINMPNSLRDSFKHGHSGGAVSLRALLLLLVSLRNLEDVLNTISISNKTECKRRRRNWGWHQFSIWFAGGHEHARDEPEQARWQLSAL